jgi:hypothetical protein
VLTYFDLECRDAGVAKHQAVLAVIEMAQDQL